MDSTLGKLLKDPAVLSELMKSTEGEKIAAKIKSLYSDVDLLPEMEKVKFQEEFSHHFDKTLDSLLKANHETTRDVHNGYFCWLICAIILVACK